MEAAERPRQDPVSCDACRKRKQKCSRDHPCSNCTVRRVQCIYSNQKPPVTNNIRASTPHDLASLQAENAAIRARLDMIERNLSRLAPASDSPRPAKASRLDQPNGSGHYQQSDPSSSDPELARSYRDDVEWFEGIGFGVRIGPIDEIISRLTSNRQERFIFLPTQDETIQLMNAYVDQLDPMQHVVHIPTVRRAIEDLFRRLEGGEKVEPNDTVLLLSLLASIAHYWAPPGSGLPVLNTVEDARKIGNHWLKTTLDVLEHVKRTASPTLETVQSNLILIFLLYHMEGFSPKVRAILAGALSYARDLNLHNTDRQRVEPSQEEPQLGIIDKEMRRRVWWHLACTDWSLAIAGGPHDGSYNVNPKHMQVKLPRNISDDDLETKPAAFDRPLDEPTIMAYYLQRIRLSEISREMTDLTFGRDAEDITVDEVASVESKFKTMLAELPIFLRADEESRRQTRDIEGVHHHLLLQRYTFNLTLHARRCKFHLPLLLRASREPSYAFCRKACLDSARDVISLKGGLMVESDTLWMANSNLGGFLHLFFYATVVLVMDFCVNKAIGEEAATKEEIQESIQVLELAKGQSLAAGMFLDSLTTALRKHKIRLQGLRPKQASGENASSGTNQPDSVAEDSRPAFDYLDADGNSHTFDEIEFDEFWQTFMNPSMDLDPENWDRLICDLGQCVQGIGEE